MIYEFYRECDTYYTRTILVPAVMPSFYVTRNRRAGDNSHDEINATKR